MAKAHLNMDRVLAEYSSGVKALRAVDSILKGMADSTLEEEQPGVTRELRHYRLDMAMDILEAFDPNLAEQIKKEMA